MPGVRHSSSLRSKLSAPFPAAFRRYADPLSGPLNSYIYSILILCCPSPDYVWKYRRLSSFILFGHFVSGYYIPSTCVTGIARKMRGIPIMPGYGQGVPGKNRHKLSAIFRGTTLSPAVPLKKLRKFLAKLRKSLKLFHLSSSICYNAYTIYYIFSPKVDGM